MTSLALRPQVVKFNNQDVPVFFHENKPYVAMRPICENIGLDWAAQAQKIKRHYVLNSTMVMITTVAQDGKNREMAALPIGYLNGWLMSVDVNRVKPEIKDTLIKYQLECYDVLYNHFMPKVAEAHPNTITAEQQQAVKDAVLRKAQRDKRTYQSVYHEFYNVFDVPRYQELPLSRFDEALKWLGDGYYQHKNKQPNMSKNVYDLLKVLADAILTQNFNTSKIYRAVYELNKKEGEVLAEYAFKTNLALLRLSRTADLRSPYGRLFISEDLKTGSFTAGDQVKGSYWFHPLCDAGKLMGALYVSDRLQKELAK
ncbi:phage antirepressor N-terminal domain-containing protein [Acinetobacter brisouii]|uniref:phage antirepressor N-terminal domain-containing protein n=1 Tax=Acinetobacter brisouii TaxID=396323 RepID=UPI00124F7EA4|nr:phage antirepressor N-terminal domain-containing protein [Acinetobacter brisouii]